MFCHRHFMSSGIPGLVAAGANPSFSASAWKLLGYISQQRNISMGIPRIEKKKERVGAILTASTQDLLCDPTERLQEYLDVPITGEGEKPFRPTREDMALAQDIFTSKKKLDIRLINSMVDPKKAPLYHLPEIAFLGRSNVGKSSLIKAIFNKAPYVKVPTSKVPGYTKTLRFYQVKDFFTLVDMPGYGFAEPAYFKDCVEGFLRNRTNLVRVFLMYDARDVEVSDCEIMEQLRLPYCIVLNKIDVASDALRLQRIAQVRQIRDEYASPCCFPQPFLVSSLTGEGLAYIQAFIAHITGSNELAKAQQEKDEKALRNRISDKRNLYTPDICEH